jgi:hypothetical protein
VITFPCPGLPPYSSSAYLKTGRDYAHWNPVRAKLIIPEQSLLACRWSSYPEYVKRPGQRTAWLRVDRLFDERGIPFRAELLEQMSGRMGAHHGGAERKNSPAATLRHYRLALAPAVRLSPPRFGSSARIFSAT